MFPGRSRASFNNFYRLAHLMTQDMERQFARQWRQAFDHCERQAHAQRPQHRDHFEEEHGERQRYRDHFKEYDQGRGERQQHRDHFKEYDQSCAERQRHKDQFKEEHGERQRHRDHFKEYNQAHGERQRQRDHFEEHDQARGERQPHRNYFKEYDQAERQRYRDHFERRYRDPFEEFDHGIPRGMRESFKDMYKNMEMKNQTPPNVGKDVYYKVVMRTEGNGQVKVKTMEKEPGSEWKIIVEEYKRGDKPIEDAKLNTQEKVQEKVQEKIAEPNKERPKTINESP